MITRELHVDAVIADAVDAANAEHHRDLERIYSYYPLVEKVVPIIADCPVFDPEYGDCVRICTITPGVDVTIHEVYDLCEVAPLVEALKAKDFFVTYTFDNTDKGIRHIGLTHKDCKGILGLCVILHNDQRHCRVIEVTEVRTINQYVCD